MTSFDIETIEVSDKIWQAYIERLDVLWHNTTSELTFLVYIGGFTSTDIKSMSHYERKFHFNTITAARQREQERLEQAYKS